MGFPSHFTLSFQKKSHLEDTKKNNSQNILHIYIYICVRVVSYIHMYIQSLYVCMYSATV